MKKQIKMAFLILASATILNGCKKNEILQSNSDAIKKGNIEYSAGDEKWDLLGFGVDVTRDLLERSSVSDVTIFDMKKFEHDFVDRMDAKINITNTTDGGFQYFGGGTGFDYITDINNKKSFNINGNATIEGSQIANSTEKTKDKNFNASFIKNSSDQSTHTFSSKYSYATLEAFKNAKRIRFTGDVSMELLMQYLTPEFVTNLANYSAEELVKRYGTHIMLDITLGARLRFNYSGNIRNESDTQKKSSYVKAGFGFNILKLIGLNITGDRTKEEMNKISTETFEKEYSAKYYGGSSSGQSISFDKDGNPSVNINIATWEQSVNEKNAALVDVGRAVFLHHFIIDPVKKALVKTAVEKHIKDSQIEMQELTPLYHVFSKGDKNDMYVTSTAQVDELVGRWNNEYKGLIGYILAKPEKETTPLHAMKSQGDKNDFFLTSQADADEFVRRWRNIHYGIAGYVLQKPEKGTLPMYAVFSDGDKNNIYVTSQVAVDELVNRWKNRYLGIMGYIIAP